MGTVVALAIGALDGDTPRRVWIGCTRHTGEINLKYNFKKLNQRVGIANVKHALRSGGKGVLVRRLRLPNRRANDHRDCEGVTP
jgi:hypothetical protein